MASTMAISPDYLCHSRAGVERNDLHQRRRSTSDFAWRPDHHLCLRPILQTEELAAHTFRESSEWTER